MSVNIILTEKDIERLSDYLLLDKENINDVLHEHITFSIEDIENVLHIQSIDDIIAKIVIQTRETEENQ